jgi:CHAT domain-containing protein
VGSTASSQRLGLSPLPYIPAEAAAVARHFHSPSVLIGPEATREAVEGELSKATVFHFTGHSLARPDGAALLLQLSDSGKSAPVLLGAGTLRKLDLSRLRLAVLSACNTASARNNPSGFSGLAEALQRAGVPRIVASRWAVDSVGTRTFIESFYRGTLSGLPTAVAIQRASKEMMNDPRTVHPYYWAAFSAYGRS